LPAFSDTVLNDRRLLIDGLFEPFQVKSLSMRNRIVMPAMGRHFNDDGVPAEAYIDYFRRRAEGGTGLLITEVAAIDHPVSQASPAYGRMHGEDALVVWRRVVAAVHEAGGRIMPQLVHCGTVRPVGASPNAHLGPLSPSGLQMDFESSAPAATKVAEPASIAEIDSAIQGFATSARLAKEAGFDGIEIHGAHGYLIDQFFWEKMNKRTDRYGGGLVDRTRFAVEVIGACRAAVGLDFPIFFRWSQWKQQDYWAKLCPTPQDMAAFLEPIAKAGVDVLDVSTRRVWEPEFPGSDLNAAGWTRMITGLPTITVGSIMLDHDPLPSNYRGDVASDGFDPDRRPRSIDHVLAKLNRGECDLVAIGRALIANPDTANDIAAERWDRFGQYSRDTLSTLV